MSLLGLTTKQVPQSIKYKSNCMVYVDNNFLINTFKLKVGFFTTNENPILNDIALDQIEIFFRSLVDNAIIISKEKYDEINLPFHNNVFMTHDKPNDQVIASMIFLKLVSIVKDNLDIDYVSLTSVLGNKICYTINSSSAELEALIPKKEDWWKDKSVKFDPWWLRDDTATHDSLINKDEIYEGEFSWDDLFKDEITEAEKIDNPKKASIFKIIPGGKNAD